MSLLSNYDTLGQDLKEKQKRQKGKVWRPNTERLPEGFEKPSSSDNPDHHEITYHHSQTGFKVKCPLILVPGILGTALEKFKFVNGIKITDKDVWPPINITTLQTSPLDDLLHRDLRPKTAGNSPYVDGAYDRLIRFLTEELGYEIDVDLFLFGYDWTQSNRKSGRRLAGYIKEVEAKYAWKNIPLADRKVDIINHSMGGIVTRAAMNLFGAQAKRVIYMASPHYGAPLSYGALHKDLPRVSFFYDFIITYITNLSNDRTLDKELLRLAENMASSYELLPDDHYFKRDKNIVRVDDFGADTLPIGFKETFLTNSESKLTSSAQVKDARSFKKSLGFKLPGDSYLVLAAQKYTTLNYAEINYPVAVGSQMKTEGRLPNGDGTVPLISGRGPGPYTAVVGKHVVLPNVRLTMFYIALYLQQTN